MGKQATPDHRRVRNSGTGWHQPSPKPGSDREPMAGVSPDAARSSTRCHGISSRSCNGAVRRSTACSEETSAADTRGVEASTTSSAAAKIMRQRTSIWITRLVGFTRGNLHASRVGPSVNGILKNDSPRPEDTCQVCRDRRPGLPEHILEARDRFIPYDGRCNRRTGTSLEHNIPATSRHVGDVSRRRR